MPLVRGRSNSENLTFQLCCVNKCKTKRASDDETKKHSRTSPDTQFKEFSLTKQKTRPRTDYEWIGKNISKKIRSQKSKTL